MDFFKLVETLL